MKTHFRTLTTKRNSGGREIEKRKKEKKKSTLLFLAYDNISKRAKYKKYVYIGREAKY